MAQLINDTENDQAYQFNFNTYVSALARLLSSSTIRTPLVIGIHGKWGSGKTSLMRTTRALLDAEKIPPELQDKFSFAKEKSLKQTPHRKVKTVWFNAWKYSETDDMLAALIRQIMEEMARDNLLSSIKGQFTEFLEKDWAEIISKLLGFDFEVGVEAGVKASATWKMGDLISEFLRGSRVRQSIPFYDDFQEYFNLLIQKWVGYNKNDIHKSGLLVIFIDDLDRCPPSRVANVLESILLFLDTPGCVFVIGADTEYISSAVSKYYSNYHPEFNGREFLEKVFQLGFELPPISQGDIALFLEDLLPPQRYDQDLIDLIVKTMPLNPRKLKRFINLVEFWQELIQDTLNTNQQKPEKFSFKRLQSLIIEWTAICLEHKTFEAAIRMNPPIFLTGLLLVANSSLRVDAEEDLKEDIKIASELEANAKIYLENPSIQRLLSAFPSSALGFPSVAEINLLVHLTQNWTMEKSALVK